MRAAAETPKPSCKDVIAACDDALAAKDKALELANVGLNQAKDQNGKLSQEVNDLREANGRWYHNPFVMFVFGAAAGTLTYTLLKK